MNPSSDSFLSGAHSVSVDIFMPTAAATRCPAVLVLHGSFGLQPPYGDDIVSFARALAARGMAAVMPHYLDATGTTAGSGVVLLIEPMRLTWQAIASDTLTWMAKDARLNPAQFALLGFSLGAHLALAVAMDPPRGPRPLCVVDFFGPIQGLAPHWSGMPPIQIFHGGKDETVPPSESTRLVALLVTAGKKEGSDFSFKPYPGEGHGFEGKALAQSRDEVVQFIEKSLRRVPHP